MWDLKGNATVFTNQSVFTGLLKYYNIYLKRCLLLLKKEVKSLESVSVGDEDYKIENFFLNLAVCS